MAVTEPVPVRVDAVGKAGLLGLVDHAVGEGWSLQAVCEVLKISRRRVERWQARRPDLADRKPGDIVNLETDIIGKYVEKLLHFPQEEAAPAPKQSSGITKEFLTRYGY